MEILANNPLLQWFVPVATLVGVWVAYRRFMASVVVIDPEKFNEILESRERSENRADRFREELNVERDARLKDHEALREIQREMTSMKYDAAQREKAYLALEETVKKQQKKIEKQDGLIEGYRKQIAALKEELRQFKNGAKEN